MKDGLTWSISSELTVKTHCSFQAHPNKCSKSLVLHFVRKRPLAGEQIDRNLRAVETGWFRVASYS